MSYNGITQMIQLSPTYSDAGLYPISIKATDDTDYSLSYEESFLITIQDADRPPVLSITTPQNDTTHDDSDAITFTGTATDAEDGNISNISWHSSIDGFLGNGTINKTISTGNHTITGTIQDSAGNTASSSVTLEITNIKDVISADSGVVHIRTDSGRLTNVTSYDMPDIQRPPIIFNHGLFSWNIDRLEHGQNSTITIILPESLSVNSQYWKIINGTWIDVTSLMGSNDGDDTITLTLTDGGTGDADGIANGIIVDPGGPVIPNDIPTITLLGENPVIVEIEDIYIDAGATSHDVQDGNLTSSISIINPVDVGTIAEYTITYNVADSFGVPANTVNRTVTVQDTTPPTIAPPNNLTIEATAISTTHPKTLQYIRIHAK